MSQTALQFCIPGRRFTDLPGMPRFATAEIRRIKHYAYGTAYLSALFCSLRQRHLNAKETRMRLHLSALAAYFDDLVDSTPYLPAVQQSVQQFGDSNDAGGVASVLLKQVTKDLNPQQAPIFNAYLQRVFQAEMAAKSPASSPASLAQIEKESAEKGGCAVLLFRSILANPISPEEAAALFEFGALMQRSDDIFDLWHDAQNGQKTLATYCATQKNIPLLKKKWAQQLSITQMALRACPYPGTAIQTSLYLLHYLNIITQVCLKHYQDISAHDGSLPLHDRTRMVVDLEKWKHRIDIFRHLWRTPG